MKNRNLSVLTAAVLGLATLATGCGNAEPATQAQSSQVSQENQSTQDNQAAQSTSDEEGEVTTVKAARVFVSPPYNYNDENGNQTFDDSQWNLSGSKYQKEFSQGSA